MHTLFVEYLKYKVTLFQLWVFLGSDYQGVGGGTPQISEKYYFWEYEDLWIFFWGSLQTDYLFIYLFFFGGGGVSFLYILGLFKVKIQNGNIFWRRKISNIFVYA